ncbi:MAG: hypothetical protein AAF488_04090 [Planctomycetota bacterium]
MQQNPTPPMAAVATGEPTAALSTTDVAPIQPERPQSIAADPLRPLSASRPTLRALATLLLIVVASGCVGPYQAISLEDEDPAHMRANVQDEAEPRGFLVAATLVDDSEEAREFFHHDLPAQGVVPVILHLENRGEATVRIHRDAIRLVLEDESGTALKPVSPRAMIRESQVSGWSSTWLLPLIVPYVAARERVATFNFEVARDYRRKALPDFLRIVPGDPPFSRVVFFRVSPKHLTSLERPSSLDVPVEIEADRSASGEIGKNALISVGMR